MIYLEYSIFIIFITHISKLFMRVSSFGQGIFNCQQTDFTQLFRYYIVLVTKKLSILWVFSKRKCTGVWGTLKMDVLLDAYCCSIAYNRHVQLLTVQLNRTLSEDTLLTFSCPFKACVCPWTNDVGGRTIFQVLPFHETQIALFTQKAKVRLTDSFTWL